MNGMKKMWGVAAIVALSSFTVGVGGLDAQSATTVDTNMEAQRLQDRAAELEMSYQNLGDASKLYRAVAEIHTDGPESVQPLLDAGRLAFYSGQEDQALKDYLNAGERALEWGDVLTAARVYLDAAWLADWDGDTRLAYELTQKALRLSKSPLIKVEDRRSLERRVAQQQQ